MNTPDAFFTVNDLFSLQSASLLTFVVANTYKSLLKADPKWCAFIVAMLITFFGVYIQNGEIADYVIGFFNGCLVYCCAAGITQILGSESKLTSRGGGGRIMQSHRSERDSVKRGFLTPWY